MVPVRQVDGITWRETG